MTPFESELLAVIAEALMLGDDAVSSLSPTDDLFGTLGLDSVDALEIVLAIKRSHGVLFENTSDRNQQIFASLRSLASYVDEHKKDA